jgi:hypothetical protein
MLHSPKEAESRVENEWILSPEDYHREMDRIENNIGRYPKKYRKYENYENYRVISPEATIDDYTNDSKCLFIIK